MSSGRFYMGTVKSGDSPFLLDSPELVTHGTIIGMTGSGKTGLATVLLEETLRNRIPVIILDPKGDMPNLLLQFPRLSSEDFQPWTESYKGMTREETSVRVSQQWREGLKQWGIEPTRIQKLVQNTSFKIYTPGSLSGIPINILDSLKSPDFDVEDEEIFSELIHSTTQSLLGLVGIEGDPLQSREFILLSNIIGHGWREGEDLNLESIIGYIMNPPIKKLGVFDVDTLYPRKDRMSLAMLLNNVLASPSFSCWLKGEPLKIGEYLPYGSHGGEKTPCSIFYLAHLSQSERLFFITLFLSRIIQHIRKMPGSSQLRGLIYFDEVFGYLPPYPQNPPTKTPLLTLLKQARASGTGLVLATQNPVDLDYKALSNMGTWFIGRLQTARDIDRVLDGLQSGKGIDSKKAKEILTSLRPRHFLLHSVHNPSGEPTVFSSRFTQSYLRGPMTKEDIKRLTESQEKEDKRWSTVKESPPSVIGIKGEPATGVKKIPSSSPTPVYPPPTSIIREPESSPSENPPPSLDVPPPVTIKSTRSLTGKGASSPLEPVGGGVSGEISRSTPLKWQEPIPSPPPSSFDRGRGEGPVLVGSFAPPQPLPPPPGSPRSIQEQILMGAVDTISEIPAVKSKIREISHKVNPVIDKVTSAVEKGKSLMRGETPLTPAQQDLQSGGTKTSYSHNEALSSWDFSPLPPQLPPPLDNYFLQPSAMREPGLRAVLSAGLRSFSSIKSLYIPSFFSWVRIRFDLKSANLVEYDERCYLIFPFHDPSPPIWMEEPIPVEERFILRSSSGGYRFYPLPSLILKKGEGTRLIQDLKARLLQKENITIFKNNFLKIYSRVGESLQQFEERCKTETERILEDKRSSVKKKYEKKINTLENKYRRLQQRLGNYKEDLSARQRDQMLSAGESLMGLLFGKKTINKVGSAMVRASSKKRMADTIQNHVEDIQLEMEQVESAILDLKGEIDEEMLNIEKQSDDHITPVEVRPAKGDLEIKLSGILWLPL